MLPHLPKDITEKRLEHFIINTKLSLKQAKQKLDVYYTVRGLVPELFTNRDPMCKDLIRLRQTLYPMDCSGQADSREIQRNTSTLESLSPFIPRSVLPADYGGDQATMDELSESWELKLAEWRDGFIIQENVLVDESRREETIDDNELFGFSGSFRRLDID
ncbi:uncharacterized protein LOC107035544 [Diachasma alloeum]|uniref:uncharacterized protein LOC107035544 n=1 Tax=Diachasma alloeum TaxID=454923 RepID=UPI0007384D52|nr:uncharacterized protein LOC107035544 [Diachasma alloeum]